MAALSRALLDAVNPDSARQHAERHAATQGRTVTEEDIEEASEALRDAAARPFADPALRTLLTDTARRNELVIDQLSRDEVLPGEHTAREDGEALARRVAEGRVQSFRAFIEAHKDDIDALSILYSQPYGRRRVTYRQIRELSRALERHDAHLTPERLYEDYATLDSEHVQGQQARRMLADLVALVRYAIGQAPMLEPFGHTVQQRFDRWLAEQEASGRTFTEEQRRWLTLIRDRVSTDLGAGERDLNDVPFNELGGLTRARQLFGAKELGRLLDELTDVLAA